MEGKLLGTVDFTPNGLRLIKFKDDQGTDCSIQESSDKKPHIYVGVHDGEDASYSRMHLTPTQAEELGRALIKWAGRYR